MVSKAGFDDVGMTRGISPEELGESSPQLMGQERRQKDGCVFLQNWTSKRKLQWVFFFLNMLVWQQLVDRNYSPY